MAITNSELSQITARLGVARLGTARLAGIGDTDELKPVASAEAGEFVWERETNDGDPAAPGSWTNVRKG